MDLTDPEDYGLLHKKLDELVSATFLMRKVDVYPTADCPNWNPFDQLYEESDAQFAKRLAQAYAERQKTQQRSNACGFDPSKEWSNVPLHIIALDDGQIGL